MPTEQPNLIVQNIDHSYIRVLVQDTKIKENVINLLSPFEPGYQFTPLFKAGIWDGRKRLYKIDKDSNIVTARGYAQDILNSVQKMGFVSQYHGGGFVDEITKEDFNLFVKSLNLPFPPYDYQEQAVFEMINERRLVLSAATGSGKSLICYMFLMYQHSKQRKSLLVVPSTNLVDQMYGDFESYGLKNAPELVQQIGGQHTNKELGQKPIVISTWQSLIRMDSKDFEMFDSLIIDESHGAGAECLQRIIGYAKNCEWKHGMSGTVPLDPLQRFMIIGALGQVRKVITPGELIRRGLATPVTINCIYMNHNAETNPEVKLLQKTKANYTSEEKFCTENEYRNKKVSAIISKLGAKKNVLALYTKIKHGNMLLKNCIEERTGVKDFDIINGFTPKPLEEAYINWLAHPERLFYHNAPITEEIRSKIAKFLLKKKYNAAFLYNIKSLDDIKIFFVSGAVTPSQREYIRKVLDTIDGAIIIGSWAILSTGVNFKKLDAIIFASSLKAYSKVIQAIGRVMRLFKGKHSVAIYDLVDDLRKVKRNGIQKGPDNYMLRHFKTRLTYYMDGEFPINEKEINL